MLSPSEHLGQAIRLRLVALGAAYTRSRVVCARPEMLAPEAYAAPIRDQGGSGRYWGSEPNKRRSKGRVRGRGTEEQRERVRECERVSERRSERERENRPERQRGLCLVLGRSNVGWPGTDSLRFIKRLHLRSRGASKGKKQAPSPDELSPFPPSHLGRRGPCT